MSKEHDRIWLEPAPGADEEYGQQWCWHNVWGDDAIEYIRADLATPSMSKEHTPPAQATVSVPIDPPLALLRSMAIRFDHGLAVPGYYDQPVFGAENVGHERRMESTIATMRQLYEEVVGTGFYRAIPSHPMKEED